MSSYAIFHRGAHVRGGNVLHSGICHVYLNLNRTLCLANCDDPDQTANHANHAASKLDQHCLSISQNKGGLTWPIQALLPLDK